MKKKKEHKKEKKAKKDKKHKKDKKDQKDNSGDADSRARAAAPHYGQKTGAREEETDRESAQEGT